MDSCSWEITLAKAFENPEIWMGISKAEPSREVCVKMVYADLEEIYRMATTKGDSE